MRQYRLICFDTTNESGLPPGRTGIETYTCSLFTSDLASQDYPPAGLGLRLPEYLVICGLICQDYPPAGLGLRRWHFCNTPALAWSGLPPGRTGIETDTIPGNRQQKRRQDYPPAGLGLRHAFPNRRGDLPTRQDYPPAGLGLRLIRLFDLFASTESGLPPGRTGIETSPEQAR